VSIVVVPIKGEKRKMLNVLRSLALLEHSTRQVRTWGCEEDAVNTNVSQLEQALTTEMNKATPKAKTIVIKCRVGYEGEGSNMTERKRTMDVDNESYSG
jgi:hypothetical protein